VYFQGYKGESVTKTYRHLVDLQNLIGQPLGSSEWLTIDQGRIDSFAAATGDAQWIHVDPERAALGPFGSTVAHGFLTLSLLPALLKTAFTIDDVRMTINYGLNRVRFPAIVPAASRIRAHFKLLAFEPVAGGVQLAVEMSVEREGHAKPVCVAESVVRHFL
jgi:acyl dehydratase